MLPKKRPDKSASNHPLSSSADGKRTEQSDIGDLGNASVLRYQHYELKKRYGGLARSLGLPAA